MSNQKFPPRMWAYRSISTFDEKTFSYINEPWSFAHKEKRNVLHNNEEEREYLSLEEHDSILAGLREENRVLREALEYYALPIEKYSFSGQLIYAEDDGEKARRALAKLGKEGGDETNK